MGEAARLSSRSRPAALGRVAVISLHTSPTATLGHSANGGMNVYVRRVCIAFSERGIATDVFTRRPGPDAPLMEPLAPLSRVVYLPAGPAELDKYALFEQVEPFAEHVAGWADRNRIDYDLVYSHYWLSGAAACTLRSSLRAPWAHTAHTLGIAKNRNLARGARPEPEVRLRLEGEISRSADLLVVSTASEGLDLVQAYGVRPERVSVVPAGVDLSSFRPLPRTEALRKIGCEGQRVVLFVGRLERLKGVEVALRALARATEAGHGDVRMLVLGEDSREGSDSEKQRLISVAAQLGIGARVEFRGSVPQDELAWYYSASETCLMPSYSESFGLVGLEAQACGCPVIASDVAGLASVVRDGLTGYLVAGDDPGDYAERLGRLLGSPELALRMGRAGSALAQSFGWDRTAERLRRDFEGLIRTRRAVRALSPGEAGEAVRWRSS